MSVGVFNNIISLPLVIHMRYAFYDDRSILLNVIDLFDKLNQYGLWEVKSILPIH